MELEVVQSGQACGAAVRGVDLTKPLAPAVADQIRQAWLEHHVLSFPDQPMSDDDLERFTLSFGPFGHDPFIAAIPGRTNVIAVKRTADETSPLFAENWHSDWSFQQTPPAGTCLRSIEVPPVGGETLYANQHLALDEMPADLRSSIEHKMAVHSAAKSYAPSGYLGDDDVAGRSMDIRPSIDAEATQLHPMIRAHPETGRLGLFSTIGYIVGIDGMADDQAHELLVEVYRWQTRSEFHYTHKWEPDMLVMWDNRSVLHRATGGYEGHNRLLHRTTIGERV